jgi:2,5-dichloro-2,5-cyclohexadiene-1,4-diol dehydrogenase 2
MTGRLANKVALVSGAASGIGAAIARRFAGEGASVIIGDLQLDLGRQVAADVSAAGAGTAVSVLLDVAKAESWAAAVRETVTRHGQLTTLVNCAGVTREQGLEVEDEAGWHRTIAVNQTGPFLGMQAALPALLNSGNGSVVNISSVYGLIGSPGSLAYHASKGAVRVMSKSVALEFAKRGIRVNTIFPGLISTPILSHLSQEQLDMVAAGSAMGRLGEPDDIAWGAVYLASDEAKYVSGAELIVDGAWLAGN